MSSNCLSCLFFALMNARLRILFALTFALLCPTGLLARVSDGFFAYCTSNRDGTGDCVNQEDGKTMECIIVPGQIIECEVSAVASFQCVWVSSVASNQAQFWCDPAAELVLYGSLNVNEFSPRADQDLSPVVPLPPASPGAGANVLDKVF